jgi:hypothetical protein
MTLPAKRDPGGHIRRATPLHAHIWDRDPLGHYVEPSWTSARLFEEE